MKKFIVIVLVIYPVFLFSQVPYNVYYGNLHSHTGNSDGEADPVSAFTYARDIAGLDFHAVTDHLEQISSSEWADVLNTADNFTVNGSFVAIAGYEWGSPYYGHCNVYNTTNRITEIGWLYTDWSGFRDWLIDNPPAFAEFNHPGDEDYFNNWYDFEYKGAATDATFPLIEFQNIQQATDWYELALNNGWHLAPVWNQDNHSADWGTKNDGRAGIWCDSLTREQLFDAILTNRTFATMDKNASVWIEMNGFDMGCEVQRAFNSSFKIYLSDEDIENWSSVEIVSSVGGPILTFNNIIGNIDTVITITPYSDNYLFVRAIQEDGDYLWSSPIYITGVISNTSDKLTSTFNFYPNPAKDIIIINNEKLNCDKIFIYNIACQLIKEEYLNKETTEIDISDLKKGVYILMIKNEFISLRSKLIKE